MRCRVYRSLDNPSSLFGMKGVYLVVFIVLAGASAIVSFLVGALTSSIVGTLLMIASAVGSYLAVMLLQGRFTEKELRMYLASLRIPSAIRILPIRFRYLWNRR